MGKARQKRLLAALAAGLVVAVGAWAVLRSMSRHFLFPSSEIPSVAADSEHETLAFRAADGVAGRAYFYGAADASAQAIVIFHGNRETIDHESALATSLRDRGLHAVTVEYRGYGEASASPPTEAGLYADAEAALRALDERGLGAGRRVIFGYSLGSGVAAEMAARGRCKAAVLVAPFTSVPDVVRDAAPIVPARWIVPDVFDTASKVREIRVPALVVHGDADEIVPFWMGEQLADALPDAKLVRVRGGHHGDLFQLEGDAIVDAIVALARAS